MDLINVSHLVFVLKLLEIDASVTITQAGIDAGDGYFECGEKLTLICQIPGNPSTMSWQNDSSNIPLAQCVFNNCELNPDVADKFEFSADESTGIYNLSFTVTNDNNGTTYMCDDGNKVNTTQISIKDLKPTLIQTSQNKLKAVSGCIHQNEKVSFQWKQIKATDNKESDYDISCLEGEESVETATCVSDAECGGLDLIQKVMTIYDEKGGLDDYYLKVVLSYNGVKMESAQTSDTHKVTCLEIPSNQTHKPTVDNDTETTTYANNNSSYFTKMTTVDVTVRQTHSMSKYMAIWIGGGIVVFLFILGISIFFFVYKRLISKKKRQSTIDIQDLNIQENKE